jgi:hypothetical protein
MDLREAVEKEILCHHDASFHKFFSYANFRSTKLFSKHIILWGG